MLFIQVSSFSDERYFVTVLTDVYNFKLFNELLCEEVLTVDRTQSSSSWNMIATDCVMVSLCHDIQVFFVATQERI